MELREVAIDELNKLEPLATAFYSSSKFLRGFDMERFWSAWANFIESGLGAIFAFFDDDQNIVGAIGCFSYPDVYSGEFIATEFFWYVLPEHRGCGLDLYYRFEEWAKENGCTQIRMGLLCDVMPEGIKTLYSELGFEAMEINYAKDLP